MAKPIFRREANRLDIYMKCLTVFELCKSSVETFESSQVMSPSVDHLEAR